jgi:IS1 family transposase/transposase-like protein
MLLFHNLCEGALPMISDLLCYKLLLVGLFGLCILLHVVWPYDRAASYPPIPQPTLPPRKRSKAPKLFAGLIHKPLCDACEHAVEARPQAPGAPPPLLTFTRGRKRTINTAQQCCPDQDCSYDGWTRRGNIRSNGHPGGTPWRQFQCVACDGYVQETQGTPLHGKRVVPERLVWAVGALAEGLGIGAVARVFEVDPNTVLEWLVEVADHAAAFSQYFLHDVRVTQVQLDELFALLSAVRTGEVSEAEAITRLSRSPHWVWVAMDPVAKLLLAIDVGNRTLAMAQRVVHQVVQGLAPDCAPLFLTDGFTEYMTALLTHYGHWVQPERQRVQGPTPKPRWMPLPQLLYAQVIKTIRRRRLVRVSHRVVFGTLEAVEHVLAACGWQIQTAFIERVNLSIRQHVAAVGRRVATVCKGEDGLRQQLVLYHVYYNFCLPHASLRIPFVLPEPTNGTGSAKRWQPQTPAMAAGWTDHVWSVREMLLFRVPPWPQPVGV